MMDLVDPYEHPNPNLLYCPENVPGLGCDEDELFHCSLRGCLCTEGCGGAGCSCLHQGRSNYDQDGRLKVLLQNTNEDNVADQHERSPFLECHDGCNCDVQKCLNRYDKTLTDIVNILEELIRDFNKMLNCRLILAGSF